MRRRDFVFALLLSIPGVASAQEVITLTTPVTKPSQTTVKIDWFRVDVINRTVEIRFIGENGEAGSAVFPTPAVIGPLGVLLPTGQSVISQMNTANNSTGTSMAKKLLQLIQTHGFVGAGNVTGTPQ